MLLLSQPFAWQTLSVMQEVLTLPCRVDAFSEGLYAEQAARRMHGACELPCGEARVAHGEGTMERDPSVVRDCKGSPMHNM